MRTADAVSIMMILCALAFAVDMFVSEQSLF
jgi:hypothetical protein